MNLKQHVGASEEAPLHTLIRVMCLDGQRHKGDDMCHCGKQHAKQFVFVEVLATKEILRVGRKCLAAECAILKDNMTDLEKGLKKLRGIVNIAAPEGDIDARMNRTIVSIAKDNQFLSKDAAFVYLELVVGLPQKRVGAVLLDFMRMARARVLHCFDNYLPDACSICERYVAIKVANKTASFECCGKRRALPPPPDHPFLQRTRKCDCGAAVFIQRSKEGAIHYGCRRCGKFAPDPDFVGRDKECDYCVGVTIRGRRSSTASHHPYWLCDVCGQFTN
jgi:hypothetical protein